MEMTKSVSKKTLIKLLLISFFFTIFVCITTIFLLITNHIVIVLPYNTISTKVDLNKPILQQSFKLAGIDTLTIRPSIIVRISPTPPHPEKLVRFQRTYPSPEGFIPSFGCNFNYSNFTRRIIFLNLYVKGEEYLDRIENKTERTDLINRATMMCLIDLVSPTILESEGQVKNILSEFDALRGKSTNILEFRDD